MSSRLLGRYAAAPVVHPETGEVLVDRNEEIDEDKAELIDRLGIEDVYVRSPMTCELPRGICQLCYGRDLGRGRLVAIGAAVGIIAAQSIGEPGTQFQGSRSCLRLVRRRKARQRLRTSAASSTSPVKETRSTLP